MGCNYGVGTPAAASFASIGFVDEFVVKYVVNSQTFGDNNFGKNYNISSQLITDGMFLQNGLNVNADTYHSTFSAAATTNNLQIQADVGNLNYNKEVTLVYTTNNWTTVNYANFNFANSYGFGGANLFLTPNQKDFEKWTVFATISPSVSQIPSISRNLFGLVSKRFREMDGICNNQPIGVPNKVCCAIQGKWPRVLG